MVEGLIKELRRYNDVSPYELFVVSCPLDQGLELFVGVPSERYPAHLKVDSYQDGTMRHLIYKAKLITLRMKRGTILNRAYNSRYLMNEIVCMLRFIHSIFHLTTHSLKYNYGCLLNKKLTILMN